MGYDMNEIVGEVDIELRCGVCEGLLENPVQLSECEHLFCVNCIKGCLEKQLICPIDGKPVIHTQIKAAPKLVTNLISKLKMFCQFKNNGCNTIARVDQMSDHLKDCEYNPNRRQNCLKCEAVVAKSELSAKNKCRTIDDQSRAEPNGRQTQCLPNNDKQLSSLESRVKVLEYENYKIRHDLNALKNSLGVIDSGRTDDMQTKGKLIVRIDDKSLVIDADPQEPIATIKQKVQKLESIDSNQMIVFLANTELEDNKSLSDYRIFKLHNPLFLSMVKKSMKLLVKISREKSCQLELSPKDTVGSVLALLLRKEAFDSKELVLSYRNQVLDEKRTLFSYRIKDGNYLFLNTRSELSLRNQQN